MTNNCTILTMFFDIKSLKDSTNLTRPLDFYVKNGKHTLGLKYPMVIFCDDTTLNILKDIREQEVGTEIPTQYIVKGLAEYDFYKLHYDNIVNNRKTYSTCDHGRATVSYFLMGMFKPLAFYIAKQKNFFNTTHYAWVDLGCNHIVRSLTESIPNMLNNPRPKVCVCYIHYRHHNELYPMDNYLKHGGPCGIASTSYTIEASYVDRFYNSAMSIFHEKLYTGYGHTDETVMTYCYDKNPDIFTLYYGDYYSIITNYHKSNQDQNCIFYHFIGNALRCGRNDLAIDAANSILAADQVDESIKAQLLEIVKK